MTIIKATNLSYKYLNQKDPAISGISFELNEGDALGILGPNGGGKSTLIKILSGNISGHTGKLEYFNELINQNNFPYHLIGYIPQTGNLNLSLPLRAIDYLIYAGKSQNIIDLENKIDSLAIKVGIKEKLNCFFKDMSGGEQQRILLIKSLLHAPKILLLDEPTKGLDSTGQDQLLEILKKLREDEKTTVVIIDHNINQIIRNCDKVLCLNKNSHWHNHSDLLTKNILENIYHCEFEHLLIHENEGHKNIDHSNHHQFCSHGEEKDHSHSNSNQVKHPFIWRIK